MEGVISRLYSFLYIRGFKVWITYRTQVVLTILSWILPVFTYYFTGTSLGSHLVQKTGVSNYTSFVVIGLAFQGYVSSIITTISQRIRNEQLYGTIEYYVISRAGVLGFLFYSAIWGFTLNTISGVITLLIGLPLGVIYHIDVLGTVIIIALLILSTLGFSMIAGAITMIIKQGNPISFFFSTFTTLISGTVFPISVLPLAVKYISYAIPLTWALNGLRDSMLQGASIFQLTPTILILVLFNAVLIPLGVFTYNYSFKLARLKGTLSEY
jgi:ABC-2 type transport system permease protein